MSRDPLTVVRVRRRTYGEARVVLLRERGSSLSAIARSLGLDLSFVSRVNGGSRHSRDVQEKIAFRLGLRLRDAFPEVRR